jgi:hypothetical protein
MNFSLSITLFVLMTVCATGAEHPFTLTLPPEFTGPEVVSNDSLQGVLYLYSRPSSEAGVKAFLQVGVATIPPDERIRTLEEALDGLLNPIMRHMTGVKRGEYVKGRLGPLKSLSVDYEANGSRQVLKARIICAISGGKFYFVHFRDIAKAWDAHLAPVEKALLTFSPSQ